MTYFLLLSCNAKQWAFCCIMAWVWTSFASGWYWWLFAFSNSRSNSHLLAVYLMGCEPMTLFFLSRWYLMATSWYSKNQTNHWPCWICAGWWTSDLLLCQMWDENYWPSCCFWTDTWSRRSYCVWTGKAKQWQTCSITADTNQLHVV